jgi:two-component system heavy metal sensor histidine kinase CusS
MNQPRASIVRRLQAGFALASVTTIALLALALQGALARALDREDEAVLQGQAQALLDGLARGSNQTDLLADHAEKAQWRLLGPRGQVLALSPGMAKVPPLPWPPPGGPPAEVESAQHHPFTILTVARQPVMSEDARGQVLQLALDRSHEETLLDRYVLLLWLSTVGAAGLATWLGRVIAVRSLAPLRKIEKDAAAIGPDARHRRLDAAGYPVELRDLVASLNGTFARMDGAFGRLTELGSELAHELRTPLQTLRAMLEGLLMHQAPAEVVRDRLGAALEEVDRLTSMVEQMLFLARAEDPRTLVQRQPLDIRAELEHTAAFFQAGADEHGVVLAVLAPPGLVVQADRGLLQRALHNLLANALRHGPAGGTVRLEAGTDAQGAWLAVHDDGPGLPVGLQARLGERFLRDDPSRARDTGGTGLGLAIVQSIARLHGGTLEFPDGWPRLTLPVNPP